MDDLLSTDWNAAPAANSNGPPRSTYTIPVSSINTSRASPAPSPFANNLNAPKPTSKAPSPANDSFAGLLGSNSSRGQGNLTLQERQKQLLQEKQRQEQEQKQRYAQQYGGGDFWDNLGSGKSTPQPLVQRNAPVHDEDDLLAAFNSAAPVDKSSHFPPPAASAAASGRNTPAVANSNALLADDDDDDPFGLGAGPQRQATPAHLPPVAMDDDDDILGDLGKPVTAKPPRRETVDEAFAMNDSRSPSPPPQPPSRSDPLDRPIAELVDMGFPADRSKMALQETGGNVQAAVGWLLNQAHQESRERSQAGGGSARASPAPPQAQRDEPRRGREAPDAAMPAWMRQESRPSSTQRRQDNQSPATDRDVAAYASEFGTSLFKSANSLWKTGQKKVQKAVAEFQTEGGDTHQPKWMRDASADRAPAQIGRSSTPRSAAQAQAAADRTNEAMLLEAGDRPRPQKSRTPDMREPISRPDSRVHSPVQDLPVRTTPQPRFMQQAPPAQDKRPLGKLTRQDIEAQSTQNYISPARRKKAATPKPEPQPEPKVDLFSPAPVAPSPQPAPTRTPSAPRPTAVKPSTPAPRPQAPPRAIPSISPSALSTSTTHRHAGTAAFKRGDYDAAHTSYTSALTPLPPTHPLTILLLTNRALTALKTGDPKLAISDSDRAIALIGPSLGENEKIDLGSEGQKEMKESYGKALMRKAEALEHMEKWDDAAGVWRMAVSAGVGGAISLRSRDRCEKAARGGDSSSATKPTPVATRPITTTTTKTPAGKAIPTPRPAISQPQSAEAVRKLRAANAAADAVDDEKFALTDSVTARVDGWKNGKTDNLRALLGSLDTVLWEGSGWKKVGMSELILANRVKVVYMRAIGKVHPDKVPLTATTEQKMISGSVFSILNEAWDKFKNENGL